MKSITDVINENNHVVSNSVQILENSNLFNDETDEQLLEGVFEKFSKVQYNIFNNQNLVVEAMNTDQDIFEAYEDEMLTESEARVTTNFMETLCEMLIASYEEEMRVNESFKDALNNIKNSITDAYYKAAEKVKGLKELLKEIAKNGIKSIKELAKKFLDILFAAMIGVGELFQRLNLKDEEYAVAFAEAGESIYKNEGDDIKKAGVDLLSEGLFNWGKKKKKEEEEKKDDDGESTEDIYSKSVENRKKEDKHPKLKKFGKHLIHIAAYAITTIIIPLIITCASGGAAVGIAQLFRNIMMLFWAGNSGLKAIKNFRQTYKSAKWKEMGKKEKGVQILILVASLAFAGLNAVPALKGFKLFGEDVIAKGFTNALTSMKLDNVLVHSAERINKVFQKLGGSFKGYENIVEYQEALAKEIKFKLIGRVVKDAKISPEAWDAKFGDVMRDVRATGFVKSFAEKAANGEIPNPNPNCDWFGFNVKNPGGPTKLFNNMDTSALEEQFGPNWKDFLDIRKPHSTYHGQDTGTLLIGVKKDAPEGLADALLKGMKGTLEANNQGGFEALPILFKNTGKIAKNIAVEKVVKFAPTLAMSFGIGGLHNLTQDTGEFILRLGSNATRSNKLYHIKDFESISYSNFISKYSDIQSVGGPEKESVKSIIETMKKNAEAAKKAAENADEKEKAAMNKIVEELNNALEKHKILIFKGTPIKTKKKGKQVEPSEDATKESLETINLSDFIIENLYEDDVMHSSLSDYLNENIEQDIFEWSLFGKKKNKAEENSEGSEGGNNEGSKEESKGDSEGDSKGSEGSEGNNEGEEKNEPEVKSKDSDLIDVMYMCPHLMCCGDLAQSSSKGMRKKPYYFKGLLSSIEIITTENGARLKDIINMFIKMFQESVKIAYKFALDKPCYKEKKKWVVNADSKMKGNRKDYGDLTNAEITEIFIDKNKVKDMLGGVKKSGNRTLEKNTSAKEIEKQKKNKLQFIDIIENDEEVKEFLDKHKKIKKFLLDDNGKVKIKRDSEGNIDLDDEKSPFNAAYDIITRAEAAFTSGKTKKELFGRVKDFFSRANKDENDNEKALRKLDPQDLSIFAQLLSKVKYQKDNKKPQKDNNSLIHPLYVGMRISEDAVDNNAFNMNMQQIVEEFDDWLDNEEMFDEDLQQPEPLIEE